MTLEKIDGIKLACNYLDETYSKSNKHKYMLGDCILAKFNLLKPEKVRENPNFESTIESQKQIIKELYEQLNNARFIIANEVEFQTY